MLLCIAQWWCGHQAIAEPAVKRKTKDRKKPGEGLQIVDAVNHVHKMTGSPLSANHNSVINLGGFKNVMDAARHCRNDGNP